MPEGTVLESFKIQSEPKKLVNSADVKFIGNGSQIYFTTGYIEGREQKGQIRNFLNAGKLDMGSSIDIKYKDGTNKTISNEEKLTDVTDADEITINGKVYKYGKDIWQNPDLVVKIKRQEYSGEFGGFLKKVVKLWETAMEGDEAFNQFLAENVDKEGLAEIQAGIEYLQAHPIIQRSYFDWQSVNPWDLAQIKSSDDRKLSLYKHGVSMSFVESGEFIKLNSIADKIKTGEEFNQEDNAFLAALSIKDRANTICINNSFNVHLTDINKRYAVANIVEGYLSRAMVPGGVFKEHSGHYYQFSQTLKEHGVEVPDWFTPFLGDEFIYGISINGIIANLGGKYLIDRRTGEKDYMARIFDHERLHALEADARNRAACAVPDGEREFKCREGYTEALALLIKNNGSVDAALKENNDSGLLYANAVKELLYIVKDINNNDPEQFLGVELLIKGLFELPKRNQNSSPLNPIKIYYNENDIGRELNFEDKMKPYSDRRSYPYYEDITEDSSLPSDKIINIARGISFDYVRTRYPATDEVFWNALVTGAEEWPLGLLGTTSRGSAKDLILEAVLNDQEAKSQLKSIVDSYYRDYVTQIKKRFGIN